MNGTGKQSIVLLRSYDRARNVSMAKEPQMDDKAQNALKC